MKHRFVLTWAAVAASLVLGVEARAQVSRGKEFPDFTAKDAITGQQFSLSDLGGKVGCARRFLGDVVRTLRA